MHSLVSLELSAVGDFEFAVGFAGAAATGFDLSEDILTFDHFAEDAVVSIEPWALNKSDEELRSVRVWASVRHGEHATLSVFQRHVLVWELCSIDRKATSAITVREVTSLSHEVTDNTMEVGSLVGVLRFVVAGTDRSEVLSSLWVVVSVQLKAYVA